MIHTCSNLNSCHILHCLIVPYTGAMASNMHCISPWSPTKEVSLLWPIKILPAQSDNAIKVITTRMNQQHGSSGKKEGATADVLHKGILRGLQPHLGQQQQHHMQVSPAFLTKLRPLTTPCSMISRHLFHTNHLIGIHACRRNRNGTHLGFVAAGPGEPLPPWRPFP